MRKILLSILIALSISACQSVKNGSQVDSSTKINADKKSSKPIKITEQELISQNPWIFIQDQLRLDIPSNKRISIEKDKIIKANRYFQNNLERSEPYIYYIAQELKRRNMPLELTLVPLIESAYSTSAGSTANAAGLWQIVPITAKHYGMTKSQWYDPRKDFIQSTQTALDLLQYLNQRFDGDWLLTLAAYNAGEGRIKKAMEWNRSKKLPTHYWALNLSKETMQYIPKLLAMVDIVKNAQQYHIELPNLDKNNALVQIDLNKQISLFKIAEYAGIELDELLEYNAGYSKKVVKGPFHVFVPAANAKPLYDKLSQLRLVSNKIVDPALRPLEQNTTKMEKPNIKLTNNKYTDVTDQDINKYEQLHKQYSQIIYRIKSGDNLSSIAQKHKVKVSELIAWNKITNANKLRPGDKLTINIKHNNRG